MALALITYEVSFIGWCVIVEFTVSRYGQLVNFGSVSWLVSNYWITGSLDLWITGSGEWSTTVGSTPSLWSLVPCVGLSVRFSGWFLEYWVSGSSESKGFGCWLRGAFLGWQCLLWMVVTACVRGSWLVAHGAWCMAYAWLMALLSLTNSHLCMRWVRVSVNSHIEMCGVLT
jgi:hypothetical protein